MQGLLITHQHSGGKFATWIIVCPQKCSTGRVISRKMGIQMESINKPWRQQLLRWLIHYPSVHNSCRMEEQRLLHREGTLRGGKGDRVVVEVRDKHWYCQVQKRLKNPHIFSKAASKLDYFSSQQHLLLRLLLVLLLENNRQWKQKRLVCLRAISVFSPKTSGCCNAETADAPRNGPKHAQCTHASSWGEW